MNITIECVAASAATACQVRNEVFGHEWRVTLPELSQYAPERQLTLVAHDQSSNEAVAVLTVLDTTGEDEIHARLGLPYLHSERVARYTQMAVLKPYRGLNLPVRLILEAQRRFVGPKGIRHTWLLFDAERARTSSFCRLLGFSAGSRRFLTEYGCSRTLTRDEASAQAKSCDRLAQGWVDSPIYASVPRPVVAGAREARW